MSDGPFHGTKGKITRLGLQSHTLHFVAETFEDVFRIVRENSSFQGIPRADSDYTQRPGKCFDVWITFEGENPDQSFGALATQDEEWEFIPEWSEEKIEQCPNLGKLMEKYLGYWGPDERVKFPPYWQKSVAVGSRLALKKTYRDELAINPMNNRDTYFCTGGVARLTTLVRRVPDDAYQNVNRIHKKLPIADLAHLDWGDRDWLETDPTPRKRGNLIELTREFKMSKPGGWGPEIQLLIDQR